MNEANIIYQETNPYSSFTAYLEEDGRTVYLYLQCENNPEWGIKTLWIRNLITAPDSRDIEDYSKGLAPLLIQEEVFQKDGLPCPKPEDIHFLWTEEGDGVFLFIQDNMEAFLPSWSGIQNFHGYARGAKEDAISASPLGDPNNGLIYDRMVSSRKFWEFRSEKDSWSRIQKKRLYYLESVFGTHTKYWSADGGKFPHIGIALFTPEFQSNLKIFVTIGMSAQNQPSIELYHKEYQKFSRIELLLAIRTPENLDRSEEWVQHLLGEMVQFPWKTGNWLGHGHNLQMNRRDPDQLYLSFSSCALRNISNPNIYSLVTSSPFPILLGCESENNEPVNYLALIPISEEEKFIMQSDGSKKLFDRLDELNLGYVHDPERKFLYER